jgi:photosystem II stability/assembly factor-like uncharacterized protein
MPSEGATTMIRLLAIASCLSLGLSSAFSQWTLQSSPTGAYLSDVQFAGRQHGWIVGDSSVFLRTTDAGSTWTKQTLGDFGLWKMKFLTPSLGWIVGHTKGKSSLVLKTTDGGNSWTVQDSSYAGIGLQGVSFVDSLHGWTIGSAYYPDTSGRIYRTTNGGASWLAADSPHVAWPNDIFFVDTSRGFAVGEYGGIVRTTDGGVTWQTAFRASWGTALEPLRKVLFTTPDSGWAVGGISGVETKVRTTDGGVTWQIENTDQGSSLYGLWFADSKNGWTVGGTNAGLVIERTTDGGINWTKQQFPPNAPASSYFESVCMIDANEGWVVGDHGTILRTSNGGLVTEAQSAPVLPESLRLFQNYPNPFNPSTAIRFSLPSAAYCRLSVFSVLGQEVRVLYEGVAGAGEHSVQFTAEGLPSGIYFYRLESAGFVQTRKMALVK